MEHTFKTFGTMLDCSRNAVMTVDAVKRWIDLTAKLGCNTLHLYMEDTYEVDGQPYFGHLRGRYSKAELKQIDAYAAAHGMQVIPCIHTLAHVNALFHWPVYREIRDAADILLIPALTGYIDKANKEKVVSETRMVVMAVQTVTSEVYGQLGAGSDFCSSTKVNTNDWLSALGTDGKYITEIKKLAEVFDSNPKATFNATATAQGKVLTLSYNNGVYTCTYNANEQSYTTIKNPTEASLPSGSSVVFG